MNISQQRNNPVILSKRLAAAASVVREGSVIADVGCDHGKLPASLCFQGKCRKAYAIDISEPSLEKARNLFARLGVKNAETILADGLPDYCDDADDIIMAGIGADVIADVVDRADWLRDESKRLILVPSSHHPHLRSFLYSRCFVLLSETAVLENGRYYTVMCASYRAGTQTLPNYLAETGVLDAREPQSRGYIIHTKNKLMSALEGEKCSHSPDNEHVRQLEETIDYIDKLLKEGQQKW